jgi:hypothetical protein
MSDAFFGLLLILRKCMVQTAKKSIQQIRRQWRVSEYREGPCMLQYIIICRMYNFMLTVQNVKCRNMYEYIKHKYVEWVMHLLVLYSS